MMNVAGILHTIFFHRTLTLVRPKDVDCDLFEITYVSITYPEKRNYVTITFLLLKELLFPPYIRILLSSRLDTGVCADIL
jgi:hypothetical protein